MIKTFLAAEIIVIGLNLLRIAKKLDKKLFNTFMDMFFTEYEKANTTTPE